MGTTKWTQTHWCRFWLRFRHEDASCCHTLRLRVDTSERLRRDEDGQSRHAVRPVAGRTVPLRRRRHQRLRTEPFAGASAFRFLSASTRLRTLQLPRNGRNRSSADREGCRRRPEESAQAAYNILEPTAASTRSSLPEDAILSVAWARRVGCSAGTYADTGD